MCVQAVICFISMRSSLQDMCSTSSQNKNRMSTSIDAPGQVTQLSLSILSHSKLASRITSAESIPFELDVCSVRVNTHAAWCYKPT